MSRRRTALAAALALMALGSPLIAGRGGQTKITEEVSNPEADISSDDILALNDEIADCTRQ